MKSWTIAALLVIGTAGSAQTQGCPFNLNVRNDGPQPIWVENFSSTGQGSASRVRAGGVWRNLVIGQWRPTGSATQGGNPVTENYWFQLLPGASSGDIFYPDPVQCAAARRYRIRYSCADGVDRGNETYSYYPGYNTYSANAELAEGGEISIGEECSAGTAPGDRRSGGRDDPAQPRTPTAGETGGDRDRDRGANPRQQPRPGDRGDGSGDRDADANEPRFIPAPDIGDTRDDTGNAGDADGDAPRGGGVDLGTRSVSLSCPSTQSVGSTVYAGAFDDGFGYQLGFGQSATRQWGGYGNAGGVFYFVGAEIEPDEGRLLCRYDYVTHVVMPNSTRNASNSQLSTGAAGVEIFSDLGQCRADAGFNSQGQCAGTAENGAYPNSSWNGDGPQQYRAQACRAVCEAPVTLQYVPR
jgi:hypothetical protein